jgi:hypothetical protein
MIQISTCSLANIPGVATLDLGEQGRGPLKHTNCGVYISMRGKKFDYLRRVWIPIFRLDKLSITSQIFGTKISKSVVKKAFWAALCVQW